MNPNDQDFSPDPTAELLACHAIAHGIATKDGYGNWYIGDAPPTPAATELLQHAYIHNRDLIDTLYRARHSDQPGR
jgi:hypothetical protein